MPGPLPRALAAEFIGTAFLLAAIVGSGIMGERLAGGNMAIALLANSIATGCALFALILVLAGISGAQLNPLVTLLAAFEGEVRARSAAAIVIVQMAGAVLGVALAHVMFDLSPWAISAKPRAGPGQLIAEAVATFGLVAVVVGTRRHGTAIIAAAVATYITSAYWFTASTSFANPAVTVARSLTQTFTGIAPRNVLPFLAAQFAGAVLAALVMRTLMSRRAAAR